MGHTPEPWKINENGEIEAHGAILGRIYGAENLPYLEEEDLDGVDKEIAANGRLIEAAPILLKFCKVASGALRSYQYGNAATELAEEVADKLDEAITKIEGS